MDDLGYNEKERGQESGKGREKRRRTERERGGGGGGEGGKGRVERWRGWRGWRGVHIIKASHQCYMHMAAVAVTPAQLIKPGIGRNAFCALRDFHFNI